MAGFTPATLDFLAELSARNERAWFEKNRARYERDVREPALAFIRALAPAIAKLSPHMRVDDRKTGGSLMRIHRDTRFAKDKTPYKTNVGIQFRHEAGKDVHAPGYYLHVALDECFLGAGLWMPEPDALRSLRQHVQQNPSRWRKLLEDKKFSAVWRQGGERLTRVPKGFEKDDPMAEELKRTSFIAVADLPPDEFLGEDASDRIAARYALTGPYMTFLCEALSVPF